MIQNSPYYSLLKNNKGKAIRLVFSDGEVAVAKVLLSMMTMRILSTI